MVDPGVKVDQLEIQKCEIVSLHTKQIQFDKTDCMLLTFKNWTNHFRFQFASNQCQVYDIIASSVTHDLRAPMRNILKQLEAATPNNFTSEFVRPQQRTHSIEAQDLDLDLDCQALILQ